MELKDHPERYQFSSHGGFSFVEGDFGEAGARFRTWETFYGLQLSLLFELTEVGEEYFRFRLLRPSLPVWGAFLIESGPEEDTRLTLRIGDTSWWGKVLLHLPLVRGAIHSQIEAEVEHIKQSILLNADQKG